MTEKRMCIIEVSDASTGFFHRHPCKNSAKHGDYCGVHDPEKIKERTKKRGPTQFERDCAQRRKENEYLESLKTVVGAARNVCDLQTGDSGGLTYLRGTLRQLDSLEE